MTGSLTDISCMSLTAKRWGPRLHCTALHCTARRGGWCRPRGWRETRMSRVAENAGSVREVRIALVCYGGVSLAIYMHGVTRELHRLVVASSRFDEESNPFEPLSTEHVYWEERARAGGQGRSPDARGRGRDLRDVSGWDQRRVSRQGARPRSFPAESPRPVAQGGGRQQAARRAAVARRPLGFKGKLAWFVLRALLARGRIIPPLRGDRMCQLLYGALSAMPPRFHLGRRRTRRARPPGGAVAPDEFAGAVCDHD